MSSSLPSFSDKDVYQIPNSSDFPPKPDSPVLAPTSHVQANVTADSTDIKSLLSSANLSTDANSQQQFLQSVVTQVLQGMAELTKPSETRSISSQVSSSSASKRDSTVSDPQERSSVSQKLSSVSTKQTRDHHAMPMIYAQGPPKNEKDFSRLNFSARNNQFPKPSYVSNPEQKTPLMNNATPSGIQPSQHSSSAESVSTTSNHSSSYVSSVTAPTQTKHQFHHQPRQSAPSPKPMVSFNIAKWSKEIKDHTLEDETFDSMLSWYDFLQQGMSIATGKPDLLPELELLHPSFDFQTHILPSPSSSIYRAGHIEYLSMSKALRIYLLKPSTIAQVCTLVVEARKIHQRERNGFSLLLHLLGAVFPHMGGPHVDVIQEISSITLRANETFDSLLHRFIGLDRKLTLSGHQVPPTALIQRYINLVKKNDKIFTLISPIHRQFHEHLVRHGPDVTFNEYSIHDIHKYVKSSGFVTHLPIMGKQKLLFAQANKATFLPSYSTYDKPADPFSSDPTDNTYQDEFPRDDVVTPQAKAATMTQSFFDRRNNRNKVPTCPICFQRHPVDRCWAKGEKHQPYWLRKNVAKYIALHPNAPEPDEAYLSQAPPLRHSTVVHQTDPQANKSVSFDPTPPTNIAPQVFDAQANKSFQTEVITSSESSVTVYHPQSHESPDGYEIAYDNQSNSESHNIREVESPTCNMANITEQNFDTDSTFSFYEA